MSQTVYLAHHGIKGQKWGVRRFQNKDGTRTNAGKKRYSLVAKTKDNYKKRQEQRHEQRAIRNKQREEERARRIKEAQERARREQIKKYAIEGYAKDMYDSNVTFLGKMIDEKTGNHRKAAEVIYNQATEKQREARAKKYEEELNNPISIGLSPQERKLKNQAVNGYRLATLKSSGDIVEQVNSFITGNFDYTGRALYVMATPERRLEVAKEYVKERDEFTQNFNDFVNDLRKRK